MRNAKDEFLSHIERSASDVKCCTISHCLDYGHLEKTFNLKVGHSEVDLEEFLKNINFDYDSGWGSQELYGTIWYNDDTWSSRGEYDGSEWWEHNKVPEIPIKLI